MRISKSVRLVCICAMSLIMSHLPSVAMAEGMISTTKVVDELSRTEAEQRIRETLNREDVKKALAEKGMSVDELNAKVASLSTHELNQLNKQMDQARYGGDILVAILIVVLIIYLIKRI